MKNYILGMLIPLVTAISNIHYPVKINKQHFQNVLVTPKFYKVRMDMIDTDEINVNQDLDKKTVIMPLIYDYQTKHSLQCIPFLCSPKIKTTEKWHLYDEICVGSIVTRYIEVTVVLYWKPNFIKITTKITKKSKLIPLSNTLIENDIGNFVKDVLMKKKIFC